MTTNLSTPPCAPAPEILTARLALIEATPDSLRASLLGASPMTDALQIHVPAEWPPEHWDQDAIEYILRKMDADPAARGWARYIVLNPVDPSARTLIGTCGATGPITPGPITPGPITPNEEPEIGYSILPAFQRQGYCTEAVHALCVWIFGHPGIASICAQTLPHLQPSIRVLEKCGFHFAGPGKEEGAILYRKPR